MPQDDENIEDAEVVVDSAALAVPSATDFTPGITPPVTDYSDDGTPTFDYVRDKIEGRIAMAAGMGELPEEATTTSSLDDQLAAREQAGKDRLEQIRRAMRNE